MNSELSKIESSEFYGSTFQGIFQNKVGDYSYTEKEKINGGQERNFDSLFYIFKHAPCF